jgi:hypothetical protein
MTRTEILKQTGNTSWNDIVEWFGEKNEGEILQICNSIWPWDDNEGIAAAIYEELN